MNYQKEIQCKKKKTRKEGLIYMQHVNIYYVISIKKNVFDLLF